MTRIFISSTSVDLLDYRQAAINTSLSLGFTPVAMEHFSAMGVGATAGSKRKVEDADLYVGIFAHRYGYIEPSNDKSVTEIEFDHAGEQGQERLCFLVDPKYPWPPESWDYENTSKLQAFKKRINGSLIRGMFTTVDDFNAKLTRALVEWQKAHNQSMRPQPTASGPISYDVPARPALLIGREDDARNLKQRFGFTFGAARMGEAKPLTIVRGWPGVGKTTLINAIVHDPDLEKIFPDGVLWTALGPQANAIILMKRWIQALGGSDRVQERDDVIRELARVLGRKRMLLVVDDVWDVNDGLAFKAAAGHSTMLITTRFPGLARELAARPDDVYLLGQLSDEKAFELLQQLAPNVTQQYPQESHRLAYDLEGLPLAIRVAGRLLEAELGLRVNELFRQLRDSHILLEKKAPDDRYDPHTGTTPTVDLLFKQSTDLLDPESRLAFSYLGVFAPKPATFDLDAIAAIWSTGQADDLVRKLVDRGLLEPIPRDGRFQMHGVLVMHAQKMLEDADKQSNTPPPATSQQPTTPQPVRSQPTASQPSTKVTDPEIERLLKQISRLETQAKAGRHVQPEIDRLRAQIKARGG